MPKIETRTETDSFGAIEVAADRYWGAQSQRSIGNFKIGWEKQPAPIVRALGIIKRAAAEANVGLGRLDPSLAGAIVQAADEVAFHISHIHFTYTFHISYIHFTCISRETDAGRNIICNVCINNKK